MGTQINITLKTSPSGYGICWPDLDEDISIDGLLGVKHARIEKTIAT